jgi:hypothetical protein
MSLKKALIKIEIQVEPESQCDRRPVYFIEIIHGDPGKCLQRDELEALHPSGLSRGYPKRSSAGAAGAREAYAAAPSGWG